MTGREAAFFDLDKTLMAGSSSMAFARIASTRGIISRRQVAGWAIDHLRFRLRGTSDEETGRILTVAQESIAGADAAVIDRMWPEVLALILPRLHREVLAEVYRHLDAGRFAFIVSAAGSEMVASLAELLGMDGGIGTRYRVVDGRYTGELAGPFVYGPGKAEAIAEIVDDYDLDLEGSWAYSDAVSDLPMLELVGNPVVVDPDAELARTAAERGWQELRLDRLGRKLAVTAGVSLAAAATIGHFTIGQREPVRRRRAELLRALRPPWR